MAKTQTFTQACSQIGSFTYAKYFTLYVVLTNRDGNSATNKSYVDYNVYCRSSGSGSISANHDLYFSLNGNVIRNENVYVNVSSPNANIAIASGTLEIEHTSDGSKIIPFGASISATGGYGVSASKTGTFELEKIPRYANLTSLSVKSRTVDSITLSYTTDRPAWIFINLNNGENWLNGGEPFKSNTTGGELTIYYKDRASTKKLDPNTSYNITVLCRALNRDSQIDTLKDIQASTYDIARISTLNNFEHGNSPNVIITNPGNISNLNLDIKIGDIFILNRTVQTGNNSIIFNDTELDNLYKKYGSSSKLTATFVLTGSGYTNSKTCEVTFKGNQKTIKTNISNSWKRGKIFTNINGTWKKAVIWINVNGTWKRSI